MAKWRMIAVGLDQQHRLRRIGGQAIGKNAAG